MSIDERLEALTQAVELLAPMHQDHKQMFLERQKQIDQMFQSMATQVQSMATQFQRRDEQFNERLRAIEALIARRDDQFDRRFEAIEALFARRDQQFNERFVENEARLAQLMDTMNRLGRILEVHDQTIDEHERRLDDLDKPRH